MLDDLLGLKKTSKRNSWVGICNPRAVVIVLAITTIIFYDLDPGDQGFVALFLYCFLNLSYTTVTDAYVIFVESFRKCGNVCTAGKYYLAQLRNFFPIFVFTIRLKAGLNQIKIH